MIDSWDSRPRLHRPIATAQTHTQTHAVCDSDRVERSGEKRGDGEIHWKKSARVIMLFDWQGAARRLDRTRM